MLVELARSLPTWLLLGLLLGAVFAVAVFGIMLVGQRLFPTNRPEPNADSIDDERRRTEIRQYLGAIGESFEENGTAHNREVAFYLPERDVAITFDARAFFHIRRHGGEAVLVEHEMPSAHLSGRLPFETPAFDYGRSTDRTTVETAYAVLGLPPGADEEAVEAAYRERIKEVHPDQGGTAEAFRRVQEAYETLSERATAQSRSATS